MKRRTTSLITITLVAAAIATAAAADTPGTVMVKLELDGDGCVASMPTVIEETPAWIFANPEGEFVNKAEVTFLLTHVDEASNEIAAIRHQALKVEYNEDKVKGSGHPCETRMKNHFGDFEIAAQEMWKRRDETKIWRDKDYWKNESMSCYGFNLIAVKKKVNAGLTCGEKKMDPKIIIKDGGGGTGFSSFFDLVSGLIKLFYGLAFLCGATALVGLGVYWKTYKLSSRGS